MNVDRIRKSMEKMYKDKCDITAQIESESGGSMGGVGFDTIQVAEGQQCRLSYNNITTVSMDNISGDIKQTPKLFIDPNIIVPAGSEITVYRDNRIFHYKNTSEPAYYSTHQEIMLEIADKKA